MRFAWIAEPPFNFEEDSRLTGCDVEVARLAFAQLQEHFDPIETDFADLLPGLASGRWDITTGMFLTPERAQLAFFTVPIWSLRDGLLVSRHNCTKWSGYRDLAANQEKIAVLKGQVQHRTALALGVAEENITVFRSYDEAAEAVAAGSVAAYASVEMAHLAYISNNRSDLACVAVSAAEKEPDHGAFACRSVAIRDRLSAFLKEFVGSSEHRNLLRAFALDPAQLLPS